MKAAAQNKSQVRTSIISPPTLRCNILNTALPNIGPLSHPTAAEATIPIMPIGMGSSVIHVPIRSEYLSIKTAPPVVVQPQAPIEAIRLYFRRERRREKYSFQASGVEGGEAGVEGGSAVADEVEVERVISLTGNARLLARLCVGLQLDNAVVAIIFDLGRLEIRPAPRLEAVLGQAIDWTRKPWMVKRWGAEGIRIIVLVDVLYICVV